MTVDNIFLLLALMFAWGSMLFAGSAIANILTKYQIRRKISKRIPLQ